MKPRLFLVPTSLGNSEIAWLPEPERQHILHVRHFIVETEKTARKHLRSLGLSTPLRELMLYPIPKPIAPSEIEALLSPLLAGHDAGLISDAGCPAVADPGAQVVERAHEHNIPVIPLIGPSSLMLALMASGANGQRFTFHGYLPIPPMQRLHAIKRLEQRSRHDDETQIMIETPYRNQALISQLRSTLSPSTRLTVACDLTLPSQCIVSRRVADWTTITTDFSKRPAIIIVYAKR